MTPNLLLQQTIEWDALHPEARDDFYALGLMLLDDWLSWKTGTLFLPFEGYRTPRRQQQLFATGKSKAKPFQSAHQFGLAVDYVPFKPYRTDGTKFRALPAGKRDGVWTWDGGYLDWDHLDKAAAVVGLERPISWDRAHIQHRLFTKPPF